MSRMDFSKIANRYEDYSLVQKSAGDILLNLLEIRDNDDILDLGCGVGNLTRKIREITTPFNPPLLRGDNPLSPPLLRGNEGVVIGIDSSEGMIQEAKEKSRDLDITFEVKGAEDMNYENCFDVIFCNSVMQWFKEPHRVVKNCYTALRKGGRIGVQAPAKRVYSPNFKGAIKKIKEDPRTKDIFAHFKSPWFFFETSDEYKDLFESVGFKVVFSKIEEVKTRHTSEDVFKIFSSGAIAGYLNQDFYDVKIDDDYTVNFTKIVKDAFVQQADNNGEVELIFNRIFLIANKREH